MGLMPSGVIVRKMLQSCEKSGCLVNFHPAGPIFMLRGVPRGHGSSVANFDFKGKIRKSGIGNSMTYRYKNSQKSKFRQNYKVCVDRFAIVAWQSSGSHMS